MLNKEADKTLLHSPLKLDCDRRKRTTISLTLSLNKHYNASVANWMWALIIYFPFFTRAHAFPFSYIFQGHFKVTIQSVSLFEIQLPCFTYSLARDLKWKVQYSLPSTPNWHWVQTNIYIPGWSNIDEENKKDSEIQASKVIPSYKYCKPGPFLHKLEVGIWARGTLVSPANIWRIVSYRTS